MSIRPGSTVVKDPQANLVYEWDWADWLVGGALIQSSTFTVSTVDGDATPLAADHDEIDGDGSSTRIRLTGGTVGTIYTVTNRIVTNETAAQTDDRSILVRIASQ